jgi:hypothetical protein
MCDWFDRQVRLIMTAPIAQQRNIVLPTKWRLLRALAQDGPRRVDALMQEAAETAHGSAALEALLEEGLVALLDRTPPSPTVSATERGRVVLDTIRPFS